MTGGRRERASDAKTRSRNKRTPRVPKKTKLTGGKERYADSRKGPFGKKEINQGEKNLRCQGRPNGRGSPSGGREKEKRTDLEKNGETSAKRILKKRIQTINKGGETASSSKKKGGR